MYLGTEPWRRLIRKHNGRALDLLEQPRSGDRHDRSLLRLKLKLGSGTISSVSV